ncbi:NAD(P)/FAD-dependent oxidoreductase [Aeribacillus pallidus]|uniref:NAD(P)/FAD-dependent oxidoreductase n=1 Tax=Aeribacillus TaxID=1055323 RepID=UPI0009EF5C72|nr:MULTISPECIES: NAD(P)/FAD-dependent oxidoreductase [Aeribacillus]MED0649432.1 NAD(P)/FAD-dependent oxidoreductase [Aeribacillus composti]MED4488602.1 NAD(P)/FAD-dependent oxidoreductase [Aeribacillus pallidus]BBU39381.1 thioredoxin-disulfide reductase [Aeribacillus pallidus]
MKTYDCIIVGGGIAGLSAAIMLGRYKHNVLVIDKMNGRSTLCRSYHNLLGWPDGVSGQTLRTLGREHAEKYGVKFLKKLAAKVEKQGKDFLIETDDRSIYKTKKLLIATGVTDRIPEVLSEIKHCLGISVYVCPDCDGYEVDGKSVIVMGAGKAGAKLALSLTYWTKDIQYVNHDGEEINAALKNELSNKNIEYIKERLTKVMRDGEWFKGVELESGRRLLADRGFLGFGGNRVHSDLAAQLGAERLENKHLVIHARTKETSVQNVWAAGDVAAHSEQAAIAMGDGIQAAIWIHKRLLEEQRT